MINIWYLYYFDVYSKDIVDDRSNQDPQKDPP